MNKLFGILPIIFIASISTEKLRDLILRDPELVVPGLGAERIILNEKIGAAIFRYRGRPFKLSKFSDSKKIFRDILKIRSPIEIAYDRIYYYTGDRLILFSNKGKVKCIIGFNKGRITSDSISLDKGVDYFIFNYGSGGLRELKNKNNTIYIFLKQGIALIDDKRDNRIDMYLIFNKVSHVSK